MLHPVKKDAAPPVLPSWDPFNELRRFFKQNARLAIEHEDPTEQRAAETKPAPRKASAEA